ncbi:terpene synthase family protein [Aspergillus homomorphus CBS 101889]|uniref:Terpene synthase n=1 Tax=Aspergillus homomorphus (strain CBS 101889) TaxID=1450537 RepID=A0A395I595_ASPHC|nr:terpenoid synthase [Aspergillus homomorphus CBS 101889]RAL15167.1 terpenoid synthase [Aspergillus homomorphus CBS 101889]
MAVTIDAQQLLAEPLKGQTLTITVTPDSHQTLVDALKGQALTIPDLVMLLYPDWEVKNHENETQIRDEMENEWCPNPHKRSKLKQGNFAEQAGYFWTGCPLERLRPLAQFMYWYFIWDDDPEVDCGELTHDREGTEQYTKDTIKFMEWCLEPENYAPERTKCPIPADAKHNSGCFEDIGRAMQTGHSRGALRRYAESMYDFVASVGGVQKQRDTGFPTWDEYLANRVYSIGALPCLMAMDVTIIGVYTVTNVEASVNDIISFKKEIVDGQLDSTIPLIMHHHEMTSAQEALNVAIRDLQRSRALFDSASDCLTTGFRYRKLDTKTQIDISVLIQGCKNMMLGNVKWSLSNQRYLPNEKLDGWKVSFTI